MHLIDVRTSKQRMYKVTGTKRSCNNRRDPASIRRLYPYLVANMYKYILVTHRDQRDLTKVGVCRVVFEGVELKN